MMSYKGYYIDHITFNSKADIDAFLENKAVEAFKNSLKLYSNHNESLAYSANADKRAEYLVKQFGYTWDQIEEIEAEVM